MPGFVDEAQLHVKAGNGGAGSVSFRREAHVSKGGPDGGDGGRGGDVWLVADPGLASLLGFRDHPHRRASDGVHGAGKQKRGANGPDLLVKVPVGTTVRRLDGTPVADLSVAGDRALVARGGRGGKGNARFLSNKRRAPSFAEQAEIGEEHWFDIELKLVADVALVGFPNAGKSTFISSVSAAKPKIADYPFTTLEPNLGVVVTGRDRDETEFVIADVPGLVEGAAEGKGLGHRFLRHVERARVLLLVLDLASLTTSVSDQERILLGELSRYRSELLDRPRIACGTKADVADADVLREYEDKMPIVSAVTGLGMRQLVSSLADLVRQAREEEVLSGSESVGRPSLDSELRDVEGGAAIVHHPVGESAVVIERDSQGVWVVTGRAVLRAVSLSDLTDDDALDLVQGRLKRLGVERALVRAGVRDGDQVQIGELSFTYHPDDLQPDTDDASSEDARRKRAKDRLAERSARRS